MPNDLELLAWVAYGLAVANAHPEVLAAADEQTAGNDDDGVARFLARAFGFSEPLEGIGGEVLDLVLARRAGVGDRAWSRLVANVLILARQLSCTTAPWAAAAALDALAHENA